MAPSREVKRLHPAPASPCNRTSWKKKQQSRLRPAGLAFGFSSAPASWSARLWMGPGAIHLVCHTLKVCPPDGCVQQVSQLNQEGDGFLDGQADSSSWTISASLPQAQVWGMDSTAGNTQSLATASAKAEALTCSLVQPAWPFRRMLRKKTLLGLSLRKTWQAVLSPGLSELGRSCSLSLALEEHFRALGPVLCVPSLGWRLSKDCWLLSLTELTAESSNSSQITSEWWGKEKEKSELIYWFHFKLLVCSLISKSM